MKAFDEICKAVAGYTLLDEGRLNSLWGLMIDVNKRGIRGDVVECGCCKGGSAALLRAAMGTDRRLWIYDGFCGMPETGREDGDEAKKYVGSCAAVVGDVKEILDETGATEQEYVLVEGMFHETFRNCTLPAEVALLHCDADWYDSVTSVLETFYPRMPEGACVILDDFGYWEGCRLAFYDFCKKHNESPLIERVGITQAHWIKGKAHNRNG